MAPKYKRVCSKCKVTESNDWKRAKKRGTWLCSDCSYKMKHRNDSSDEEATCKITKHRYKRLFESNFRPYTSNSLSHNGIVYKSGDVVKVHGAENEFYYAQLRKFLDFDGEKSASVLWLNPKGSADINLTSSESDFNPKNFAAGTLDDRPFLLDAFTFVMRLPLDYFKSYTTPHVSLAAKDSAAICKFLRKLN